MKNFDVIIIGGGVIGCMTARALSRYEISVLLIEKEADIGSATSSANSAIIHAGHDPLPGTLKAEMNLRGNPMWDQVSADLGIPFTRCGAYVVAIGDEQRAQLDCLMERARENNVPCELISGEEMRRREPLVNPEVSGALFTPTAGMVDTFAACIAPIENAIANGVEVRTQTEFQDFILNGCQITGVKTSRGDFSCRWVINAAGLYSDEVMHKAGERPDFKISSRKGEYFILDKSEIDLKNILFPVPTSVSKGILVLGSTHGNVLVGPNSLDEPTRDDTSVTSGGLSEIWENAQKMVPSLKQRSIIAVFAGMRASGNASAHKPELNYHHDFLIELAENTRGLINLGGIESPGLTAAPAIADRIVELLSEAGEKLVEKKGWNPIRIPRPRFNHLSRAEQAELVKKDPRYGRVVCRCEMVTEGEIIAEIHAPLPATTYDAVKRRTWLGTGRCLGSFDMPRVIELLSLELGIPVTEVTKKGPGSEFLIRPTKEVEA